MKILTRRFSQLALPFLGAIAIAGCGAATKPAAPTDPPKTTASTADAQSADANAAPKPKPAAGMGNAIGRILFDGKGAANIEVELCEKISAFRGCSGSTFQARTNKYGYYVIEKVKPGEYSLAVRIFDTDRFVYPTTGILSAAKFKVEKDESLTVRTVNIYKSNLVVISPKNGSTVKTGKLKIAWKAYPNATNYKYRVYAKRGATSTIRGETSENSVTLEKSLLNGEFKIKVEAFNASGTKISQTNSFSKFKVTGQSGSTQVEVLHPKIDSTIGPNLTLKWKAHPKASEYRIYLKRVKAKTAILKYEKTNATSFKIATPLPPDRYYWSVNAYEGREKIASSTLQKFTVK